MLWLIFLSFKCEQPAWKSVIFKFLQIADISFVQISPMRRPKCDPEETHEGTPSSTPPVASQTPKLPLELDPAKAIRTLPNPSRPRGGPFRPDLTWPLTSDPLALTPAWKLTGEKLSTGRDASDSLSSRWTEDASQRTNWTFLSSDYQSIIL